MFAISDQSRIADFQLMMMDIESEHLGIPDTDYEVTVRMPSAELQRIIRDLASFGDSGTFVQKFLHLLIFRSMQDLTKVLCFLGIVMITVTKEGIRFSTTGDIGAANITCKHNVATEKVFLHRTFCSLSSQGLCLNIVLFTSG